MRNYSFLTKLLFTLFLSLLSQQSLWAQLGASASTVYFLGADRAQMKGMRTYQTEVFYSFSIPGVKGDTVPKSHFRWSPAFQWTSLHLKANMEVSRSNGVTGFQSLTDPDIEFCTSDLHIGAAQLRGQLRMKNKSGDAYARYAPGLYVGYRMTGRFKRTFKQEGALEKLKMPLRDDPDFYGLKRLQAGHFGTFTYGMLSLWYGVSFTPFFEAEQGPLLREVRFGAIIGLPIYFKKGKMVHFPSISI